MRIPALALIAALALAAPRAARAQDGTTDILIDPVAGATILAPGSYRLVEDVTMTADAVAVTVSAVVAGKVTLDLGGHSITGFAGSGFDGISAPADDVTVMNGTISGFGQSGVEVTGVRAVVRNVRVVGCNTIGGAAPIRVANEGLVEGCSVSGNAPSSGSALGILAGNQCRIVGNIVKGNASADSQAIGILAQAECEIVGNVVSGNSGASSSACNGISAFTRCIIRGNVVSDNDNTGTSLAIGISAQAGSLIERNVCSNQNTGISGGASAIGIQAAQSTIVGNECIGNSAVLGSNGSGVGIDAQSGCLVRDNRCEGNNGNGMGAANGIKASGGVVVQGNHCQANTGGAASHGIRVIGAGNLIGGNSTAGHTHGGIIFLVATNNRCRANECREAEVIESTAPGVSPASLGAGDLANVLY